MARIQGLVARQALKWELDKNVSRRFAQDEAAGGTSKMVVTVSREKASGGSEAAKLVAKELGYDLYDKEIIDAVASKARTDQEKVKDKDDRGPNLVRDILLGFLEGNHLTETAYLRALVKVLRHIAEQGNAVVIGRGASCVLKKSLKVRIIAPFDLRVERVRELDHVSLDQARRTVLESDRARRQFVRGHFGCDPDCPMMYDLVINTESKSIEHAAELIVMAVHQRLAST